MAPPGVKELIPTRIAPNGQFVIDEFLPSSGETSPEAGASGYGNLVNQANPYGELFRQGGQVLQSALEGGGAESGDIGDTTFGDVGGGRTGDFNPVIGGSGSGSKLSGGSSGGMLAAIVAGVSAVVLLVVVLVTTRGRS